MLTVKAAGFLGCLLRSTIAWPTIAIRYRRDIQLHALGMSRFTLAGYTAQTEAHIQAHT